MMKEQSMDFNIGVIFSCIERAYVKRIKSDIEKYVDTVSIPKVWFGLRPLNIDFLSSFQVSELMQRLNSILEDLTEKSKFKIQVSAVLSNRQYIDIEYAITKKSAKKMTVEEIEKALGYKIEIVSE